MIAVMLGHDEARYRADPLPKAAFRFRDQVEIKKSGADAIRQIEGS